MAMATKQIAEGMERLLGGPVLDRSTDQLVDDLGLALLVRHSAATAAEYRRMVEHYIAFLEQWDGVSLMTARRIHVEAFVKHLGKPEGGLARLVEGCAVCRAMGNRPTDGYSASYAKRHLAAVRAAYGFLRSERVVSDDPTLGVRAPTVENRRQYVPSREEVRALMDHPGTPKGRLLVRLAYYAPARRAELARIRYCDIDEHGVWHLTAKGGRAHAYQLHPEVMRALREYARWQRTQPKLREALASDDTAYVFLSRWGRPMTDGQLVRVLKRHAIRAGVGLVPARGKEWDAIDGQTSRLSPHALRRAWASHVLNDPTSPVPIDVVSSVLGHRDIATTRKHYAFTDDDRAFEALRRHRL